MKIDWATIVIAICLAAWFISHNVLLPMFNAYLEYRRDIRMHEQDMVMYKAQVNEKSEREWKKLNERLQGNIDEPDIKQRSGESDEGTSIHDEELPL